MERQESYSRGRELSEIHNGKLYAFSRKDLWMAEGYSLGGGQALHVWAPGDGWQKNAPMVFRRSKIWGHLFDQDKARLILTARRLGVRVIVVHREGSEGQHIDLCGKPLQKALGGCVNAGSFNASTFG